MTVFWSLFVRVRFLYLESSLGFWLVVIVVCEFAVWCLSVSGILKFG